MQLMASVLLLVAAALAAAENTITFISQDNLDRWVHFDSNPGSQQLGLVFVEGLTNVTVNIPWAWAGNFYAYIDGKPSVPGMLGEFNFNAWQGLTYFDVSAIVNPNDIMNVKKIWPAGEPEPFSGCEYFPCPAFAYYAPDDVQTKATHQTHFFCTLGSIDFIDWEDPKDVARHAALAAANAKRSVDIDPTPAFSREYLIGHDA